MISNCKKQLDRSPLRTTEGKDENLSFFYLRNADAKGCWQATSIGGKTT
jgi:hypothetical protein